MKVILNVYDIIKFNKYLDFLGLGVYHTGVEIDGIEYAYGGNTLVDTTGVYRMYPKKHDVFKFKYSVEVGEVKALQ